MFLYHGTTLGSISDILHKGKLIGTRKVKTHKNAYISFTPDITMAHEYGLLIFKFEGIESNLIPVKEYDFDWVCKNKEIYEYTDCFEYKDMDELKDSRNWEELKNRVNQEVVEYVAVNEFCFNPQQVKIMVCGAMDEERNEVFQKLHSTFGDKYEITKEDNITEQCIREQVTEGDEELHNWRSIYRYEQFIRDVTNQEFYNEKDFLNG